MSIITFHNMKISDCRQETQLNQILPHQTIQSYTIIFFLKIYLKPIPVMSPCDVKVFFLRRNCMRFFSFSCISSKFNIKMQRKKNSKKGLSQSLTIHYIDLENKTCLWQHVDIRNNPFQVQR